MVWGNRHFGPETIKLNSDSIISGKSPLPSFSSCCGDAGSIVIAKSNHSNLSMIRRAPMIGLIDWRVEDSATSQVQIVKVVP